MRTVFDSPRSGKGGPAVHIDHWLIEDTSEMGVSRGIVLEFFHSARGPAFLATPFERVNGNSPSFIMDSESSYTYYSDYSVDEGITALTDGDVRGGTAERMVYSLLHKYIPSEWAEKYLPELYRRVVNTQGGWKQ